MTETKPATDEEIDTMRSSHGIDLADFQQRIGPLIARIDAERERADEAEDLVEELEREAGKVAAEFEGDATKTLGNLAAEFDETFHEWSEREDGWTVDSAAQAIYDGRADLVRRNDALAAQLAEARQQIAALREALRAVHFEAKVPRENYERNGPTWTGKDGHEYADMSHLLEKCETIEALCDAALAQTEGDEG